jgi:hypothetical protein
MEGWNSKNWRLVILEKVKYKFVYGGKKEILPAILVSDDHVISEMNGCTFLARVQPAKTHGVYENTKEEKYIHLGNFDSSIEQPPLEGTAIMLNNMSTLEFLISYQGSDDPAKFL